MSSKGSRNKRAKNVRGPNLESEKAPSLAQTIIDRHSNVIPAGRQLERTPPSKSDRVTILQTNKTDGAATEQMVKEEPCAQEIAQDISCNESNEVLQHPTIKDERKSIRRSSLTVASATTGNATSEVFIQGMQGYQWTDTDLEFVNQAKRQKQVQQIQQELSDVQKSLNSMRQMRDMAVAGHDKIQAELLKVLSPERIQQISTEILLSSSQLKGLDFKDLLAKLKVHDVLCTTAEQKTEVSKLKTEVEKAQAMRQKEEELTKEIKSCEENISQIKVTVHTLTAEIAALEFQLSGKKEVPQSTKPRQKVNKGLKSSAAPKPSKPPAAPKPSKPPAAPEPSKPLAAASASKPSKPPAAPKSSKPLAAASAPKTSKPPAPKTSKPPAPKTSKLPAATSAPKNSKPLAVPSAPKPSKPPATQKDSKTAKPSKPTPVPKAPEGDVEGLRRSKRIASKKQT